MIDRSIIKKRRTCAVIGNNIVKKNGNKTILNDLNINIEKQSIYAILGENQAGKSVLLKCLMGVLKLDGGEVKMLLTDTDTSTSIISDDILISNELDSTGTLAAHPSIGFAPQNFDLPTPMRISQWLALISAVNELPKDQIEERYKAIAMAIVGLPKFDYSVEQLGYSEKKILSLVLAIIHEPELIILDDITSGMDTTTLKNIWTLLSHMNKSTKCTIILSASNNFCYMESAVTHIGILMNGIIFKEDTVKNLMDSYGVSNLEKLLIEVILGMDDQRDPSTRIEKLPSINTTIADDNTSSLQNIFNTQIVVPEEHKNVNVTIIQVLILKNVWILAGMSSMTFILLTCALLLPMSVYIAFGVYPERGIRIAIDNQEARVTYELNESGYCDKNQSHEMMSCTFVEQNLAQSFQVVYISTENINAPSVDQFECILRFDRNYTSALQRRIEKKVLNDKDFETSQIIITMNIIDGRKADHVKDKLFKHFQDFLLDYAHKTFLDIHYNFIKYNYTSTYSTEYPIYGEFVNSGLIVFLAFFFHAFIAIHLLQQQTADDDYCRDKWKSHLSRLAVQIPMAVVWNVFMVVHTHVFYNIKAYHGYIFWCLFLESVCGMHFGYVLSSFVKNYFNINIILHLKLTISIYIAGLWWQIDELNMIINYLPIPAGVSFVRNIIEKQYFVLKLLIILLCWTVIFTIIKIVDVIVFEKVKTKTK